MYVAREVTRLGKDLLKTKNLNDESIRKTIVSLRSFKEECKKRKVQNISAVGTSALRDARNSKIFLKEVKKQTDIEIQIISGGKEAELTLKGVLGNEGRNLSAAVGPLYVIDIGGGSTEWIFSCNSADYECPAFQRTEIKMDSLQIGAVRLLEKFLHHDPPLPEELARIKDYIHEAVINSFVNHGMNDSQDTGMVKGLIATGGTATTIAAIDLELEEYAGEKVHMHRISRPALREIYLKLSKVPIDQRIKIKGLESGRVDIILPGILILLGIMDIVRADEVTVSDYGLLEGIILSD